MSGYYNYSMSNNAVRAYHEGKVPFSKLPTKIKKIGEENLRKFCQPCEYHHTSKFYNPTFFYLLEEVLATFGLQECEDYNVNPKAVEFLKNFKKPQTIVKMFNGLVGWFEWEGTRNFARKREYEAYGKIEIKNDAKMAKVILKNGKTFSKKIENLKINNNYLEFLL